LTEYVPVPDEQAIERAERRVESILRPYSSALSPEIVAEQIVAAVLAALAALEQPESPELPKAQHGQEDTSARESAQP
jgi:hypothetical protein